MSWLKESLFLRNIVFNCEKCIETYYFDCKNVVLFGLSGFKTKCNFGNYTMVGQAFISMYFCSKAFTQVSVLYKIFTQMLSLFDILQKLVKHISKIYSSEICWSIWLSLVKYWNIVLNPLSLIQKVIAIFTKFQNLH